MSQPADQSAAELARWCRERAVRYGEVGGLDDFAARFTAIADLLERGQGLLQACRLAAGRFRKYELLHRDKGAHEKARSNAEMADMLEAAIDAFLPAPPSTEKGEP